jgi:hypothetical protein
MRTSLHRDAMLKNLIPSFVALNPLRILALHSLQPHPSPPSSSINKTSNFIGTNRSMLAPYYEKKVESLNHAPCNRE